MFLKCLAHRKCQVQRLRLVRSGSRSHIQQGPHCMLIHHLEIQAPCLLHDAESMGPGAPLGMHTAIRQQDHPGRETGLLSGVPGLPLLLGKLLSIPDLSFPPSVPQGFRRAGLSESYPLLHILCIFTAFKIPPGSDSDLSLNLSFHRCRGIASFTMGALQLTFSIHELDNIYKVFVSCLVWSWDMELQILRKLTTHMSQLAAIRSRPSVVP